MAFFNGWPWTQFQEQNLDWLIRQVRKNVQDISENTDDIEELQNYLDPTVIQTDLYNIIQEMIDDGTLSGIVSQAAGVFVTPEMFGALGDGITDDSQAINDAIDTGKPVYFDQKTYNARIGITSHPHTLIGNGATILIGDNAITYDDNIYLEGIAFVNDYVSSKDFITYGSTLAGTVRIRNCVFIDRMATDAARPRTAVRARGVIVDVENLIISGAKQGVVFNNSSDVTDQESITINHIYGSNVETLVDIEGTYGSNNTGSVKDVMIDHIILYNTSAQKTGMVGAAGKDAVLAAGVINFSISDVVSVYAKERAVYLNNAKHGTITNVTAVHSEGVKIAGTTTTGMITFYTEDVHAENINVVDGYQAFALKLYDIKNVTVNNVSIDGGTYADPDSYKAVEISRTVKDLLIDGLTATNVGRGIVEFTDDSGYMTDIDQVTIQNVVGRDFCKTTSYDAIMFTQAASGTVRNITFKNWILNPYSGNYRAASNFKHVVTLQNIDNVTFDNIAAYDFGSTEEPIKVNANVTNLRILNTVLFCAVALALRSIAVLTEDSDYWNYTQSTGTYNYSVKVQRNPVRSHKDIFVTLPCNRNIYGDPSEDKNIVLEGPAIGSIKVRSGSGTPSTGFGYSSAGIVTATEAGNYHVTVVEQ